MKASLTFGQYRHNTGGRRYPILSLVTIGHPYLLFASFGIKLIRFISPIVQRNTDPKNHPIESTCLAVDVNSFVLVKAGRFIAWCSIKHVNLPCTVFSRSPGWLEWCSCMGW